MPIIKFKRCLTPVNLASTVIIADIVFRCCHSRVDTPSLSLDDREPGSVRDNVLLDADQCQSKTDMMVARVAFTGRSAVEAVRNVKVNCVRFKMSGKSILK